MPHDMIIDGEQVRNVAEKFVFVTEESDLDSISGVPAGTFAATWGYKQICS